MEATPKVLQFQQFSSTINVSFWLELARKKLDEWKLSEVAVDILATYSPTGPISSEFYLDGNAFSKEISTSSVVVQGKLVNFNTIEAFKQVDKNKIFESCCEQVSEIIFQQHLI
jgi:hypothetical protein